MKKNAKFCLILLTIIILCFTGCKEKYPNPYREEIIGRWKLIKISINKNYEKFDIIDYSKDNIICDFQGNSRLFISGSITDTLSLLDDFSEGEHFYEYSKLNVCPTCMPGTNLCIDKPVFGQIERCYYCLSLLEKESMTISGEKTVGRVVNDNGVVIEYGDSYSWEKILILLK